MNKKHGIISASPSWPMDNIREKLSVNLIRIKANVEEACDKVWVKGSYMTLRGKIREIGEIRENCEQKSLQGKIREFQYCLKL